MAENFIWGGDIIPYPETGDEAWGISATATIAAINLYCIQKTGGTYSLTADLNFGTVSGLKSKYYKSLNASPAQSGVLRLGFTDSVAWRNFGDSGDLALTVNAAGQLLFDGVVISTGTGSSGNVVGPVSSTNGAIATYGGTSGTQLLNTPVIIDNSGNVTGVGTLSATAIGSLSSINVTLGTFNSLAINTTGGTNVDVVNFKLNGAQTGQINSSTNPLYASLQIIGTNAVILAAGTVNVLTATAVGNTLCGVDLSGDDGTSKLQVGGNTLTATLNVTGTSVFNGTAHFGTSLTANLGATVGAINTLDVNTQLTAPTLGTNDNSTKVATTAFVKSVLGAGGKIAAICVMDGNGNISDNLNIASVSVVSTSTYTINFSTPLSTGAFAYAAFAFDNASTVYDFRRVSIKSANQFQFTVYNGVSQGQQRPGTIQIAIFT